MAINYFNKFPKVLFDVNNDGSFSVQVDITKTVDINTIDEDKITYYTFHEIQDGERPDNLSYNLYGTAQYYWTFFVVNDSLKEGLSNAWPLNSHAFEAMIINEYDPYSAITFNPILHESLDNNNQLPKLIAEKMESDFSVVPLIPKNDLLSPIDDQDEYLPYLRLSPALDGGGDLPTAKILKYDNTTCQLVIYDIRDSAGNVTSRDSLLNKDVFKLSWVNPYNEVTEAAAFEANKSLKARYVAAAVKYFEPIDKFYYPGFLADDLPGSVPRYLIGDEERYIFDKKYLKVRDPNTNLNNYSWPLYRNATAQYTLTQTDAVDGESITTTIPVSLYDVLRLNLANSVRITNPGSGYTTAPTVTFTAAPDGHITATGTAVINGGIVTSVIITNPGSGYTTTPSVTFSPPTSGVTAIGTSISNLRGAVGRISFYEKENQGNLNKRNIKVIRPDAIRNFSKNYFDLLNR